MQVASRVFTIGFCLPFGVPVRPTGQTERIPQVLGRAGLVQGQSWAGARTWLGLVLSGWAGFPTLGIWAGLGLWLGLGWAWAGAGAGAGAGLGRRLGPSLGLQSRGCGKGRIEYNFQLSPGGGA